MAPPKAQIMSSRLNFCTFLSTRCWLYSPAPREQKITSVPSAPESSECHVYLERVSIFFLEAPAEVSLHLIGWYWSTPVVGRGLWSSYYLGPSHMPSYRVWGHSQLYQLHINYVFPERKDYTTGRVNVCWAAESRGP